MTEPLTSGDRHATTSTSYRTKLIEVALPLEAINTASAREKSLRHGHPSTLHLWWSRKPLATCRAVLFAQMVDDPAAVPEEFPTEEAQEAERQRLFRIIEQLVQWENSANETVLNAARKEIARSLARTVGIPAPDTPEDVQRVLEEHAPPVLDPFCGGGSIPLEAQRLGLEARASDLNPLAVLITKALIEIPPKFAGTPPVNPLARQRLVQGKWTGAKGLAEDVRFYGEWMRDEAWKRMGHLYPRVKLPAEHGGGEATVIAWLWVRTVTCPNPACRAQMPLTSKWRLSTKKGKEVWVEPILDHEAKTVRFDVRSGSPTAEESRAISSGSGFVNERGKKVQATFQCVTCQSGIAKGDYIDSEANNGRMGQMPLAIVAEGRRGRVYVPFSKEQEKTARQAVDVLRQSGTTTPTETARGTFASNAQGRIYGFKTFSDYFTPRQLVALTTFSDLVSEARDRVRRDSTSAGISDDGVPMTEGGRAASAYADAVATYLGFGVDKMSDRHSTLGRWDPTPTASGIINTFSRQAIVMTWDFAEGNPFSSASGNFDGGVRWIAKVLDESLPPDGCGTSIAADASAQSFSSGVVISTDPPYYDNVGYADLSDFFYVWLRRSLRAIYPELFRTMLVPKAEELVATPYRFEGNKQKAQTFFQERLGAAFRRMRGAEHSSYPLTVYYAFRQAETDQDTEANGAVASTGWEMMLSGLIRSGFSITGTWPMRSELANRMLASGSNALASSIVLVCRPRPADAPVATRREFTSALRVELPSALVALQHGNIAPVDLAQASIGPGMAIFSRYGNVLEADGSQMSVRTALQIINYELDRYLAEQEGEMDADTRFCIAWYEQYGFKIARYGEAEVLAKAKNTSVEGLVRAGVLRARGGEVRLLAREELDPEWNPLTDQRLTDWECTQHLIRTLQSEGEAGAARLAAMLGGDRAQRARDLAYRLYAICDRKNRAEEAVPYNELVVSWPTILELAARQTPAQQSLI